MQVVNDSLSCTFFPGKYKNGESVPALYNSVYRYWHKVWGEIFTAAGSPESLSAENFLRQDIIVTLHQAGQIAGIFTTSFFNLSADVTYDHPYFKTFPKKMVQKLRSESVGHIITGEYLSVTADFRKSASGVHLSDVLVGLLMKIFVEIEAKMTFATTVRPAKVHKICEKYGWSELESFTKYGLDCLLLCNSQEQVRTHDDPEVARLVESFWQSRNDFTGLTLNQRKRAQAA
jgi:hypothetical protein